MCNFVISWFCDIVVDRSWWSTNLWFRDFVTSSYGTVMIGMSWLIQPWLPSNLRSCEFDQTGRNRIFPMPWVQVASFEQRRLVFNTWYDVSCWDQFLANRICDLFCFDRTSLNSLFWWNQNSLNGNVNWVVAVWVGVNVCFLWPWQVATSSLYWMLFCLLMMTHVSHSGSFELRLNSTVLRDWRLKGTNTSIGCVLSASCLWKKK